MLDAARRALERRFVAAVLLAAIATIAGGALIFAPFVEPAWRWFLCPLLGGIGGLSFGAALGWHADLARG